MAACFYASLQNIKVVRKLKLKASLYSLLLLLKRIIVKFHKVHSLYRLLQYFLFQVFNLMGSHIIRVFFIPVPAVLYRNITVKAF
jgi:hypothetical protein